jgi:hypothetical protein
MAPNFGNLNVLNPVAENSRRITAPAKHLKEWRLFIVFLALNENWHPAFARLDRSPSQEAARPGARAWFLIPVRNAILFAFRITAA